MKKKYIKNLYQILSTTAGYVFMEILFLVTIIKLNMVDIEQPGIEKLYIALIGIMIGLPLITIIFGFYWIFQFVSFDDLGIKIYLLNHLIKDVKWTDVKYIMYSNHMNNPTISLFLKNGSRINFDRRKKIVAVIHKNMKKNKNNIK